MAGHFFMAIMAASQAAPAEVPSEARDYGILWAMAGHCYRVHIPISHWGQSICVRRTGRALHVRHTRSHPRFGLQRDCDVAIAGPRQLAFRCGHTGPGSWPDTAVVEGNRLIVMPMGVPAETATRRWVWRLVPGGLSIEIQRLQDGRWQPLDPLLRPGEYRYDGLLPREDEPAAH